MTEDVRYVDLLWVEEIKGRDNFKSMIHSVFKVRQAALQKHLHERSAHTEDTQRPLRNLVQLLPRS